MLEFSKYNNKAGIYKWENKINHKCYIGQSINLGSRLRHHFYNIKYKRYNNPLYRAIDKYGIDNFDITVLEIVENSDTTKSDLDVLEVLYIETYNSYGKTGYNQTKGGDGGILGYKFTDEQRKKVSEYSKTHAKNKERVVIYNLETNETLTFDSIHDCSLFLNCSHSQVSRLCHWKQLKLNNVWVGSMSEDNIQERIDFVRNYTYDFHTSHKYKKKCVPGQKRHFNTPTGKKILSEEHKKKISEGLKRYNKLRKTQTDDNIIKQE